MQQRNNTEAPPVMTWGKAMPVLIVAGIFDLLRMFFQMFWFFGPALAAVGCAVAVNNTTLGAMVGSTATGAACAAAAGTVGFFGAGFIEGMGVVLSMAVGFLGFLTIGLWVVMTNSRIFKANATGFIWFMGSFAISEIPFIGALPAFTVTLFKLYRTQIRVEKLAFAKYQKEQTNISQLELQRQALQERQTQIENEAAQALAEEQAKQDALQQAARDARTDAAIKAANEDSYIPAEEPLAA